MILYKITNKLNGKIYIGQTVQTLKARLWRHFSKKSKSPLSFAVQKYGKDNFSIEELSTYKTLEDLNDAEEYYIEWYNCLSPNGYNLHTGGNNHKVSEETRKALSECRIGKKVKPFTEEHKRKISESNLGKKMSPETILKMSKPKTKEHRLKLSLVKKGKKLSDAHKKAISEGKRNG